VEIGHGLTLLPVKSLELVPLGADDNGLGVLACLEGRLVDPDVLLDCYISYRVCTLPRQKDRCLQLMQKRHTGLLGDGSVANH
jgi:hypothetical protein